MAITRTHHHPMHAKLHGIGIAVGRAMIHGHDWQSTLSGQRPVFNGVADARKPAKARICPTIVGRVYKQMDDRPRALQSGGQFIYEPA
jgi:hypothetical protein